MNVKTAEEKTRQREGKKSDAHDSRETNGWSMQKSRSESQSAEEKLLKIPPSPLTHRVFVIDAREKRNEKFICDFMSAEHYYAVGRKAVILVSLTPNRISPYFP